MNRRELIGLICGSGAVWPLAARAQQAKLSTIGFLGATTPSGASQWVTAFVQRLRELGWVEGRNIAIEYRWAEGRNQRVAEFAAEFVRLGVDIIVTWGTAPALTAKQTTSVVPIIFAVAADPLGSGLVASLSRPGGNVTGLSLQHSDLAGKQLELLREAIPQLRRMAIMCNVSSPSAVLEMHELQASARMIGLEVATLEI